MINGYVYLEFIEQTKLGYFKEAGIPGFAKSIVCFHKFQKGGF
jgi:hypothetical protein